MGNVKNYHILDHMHVKTVRQNRCKCVILQTYTFKINNWAYWCIQSTAYLGEKVQAPPTSRLERTFSSEDPCFAVLVMSDHTHSASQTSQILIDRTSYRG